jgi:curved DNA-binding protein
MKYQDYYKALGVSRTATADEIKKAYRKLAHQFHPDVSKDPQGEEKFKEIGEAYSTLKDQEKRDAYDALGSHPSGQEFRPPPNWEAGQNGQGFSFDDIDLADLFSHYTETRGRPQQNQQGQISGQDYELTTKISLEDAFQGTTVALNFSVPEYDSQGQLKRVQHSFKARIPKGVANGGKMLLPGKGGKGANGGKNGNLYLNLVFLTHRLFRVVDYDLYIDLPISPWEAALGATVKVPTMEGEVNLKVPVGSKNGQKLRISQRGMPKNSPSTNQAYGDLFAVISIVLPNHLSDSEAQLLKQLAETSSFNPRYHFEST